MKKVIGSMLLLLLLGGIASCGNDLNPEEEGNYRSQRKKDKPIMKTIQLKFGGDYVTESEEPLLRAEDGETFVGLNVYRTKKDEADAKEEMYAYGMFVGKDNININVLTGYTYRFEASILIEQTDKVAINNRKYYDPFRLHDDTSTDFDNAWGYDVSEVKEPGDKDRSFKYSYEDPAKSTWFLCQLNRGTAHVNVGNEDNLNGLTELAMRYPRVKRYYGTLNSFDPGVSNTIEIEMAYKSFGLEFILESIPAGTSVSVADRTTYTGKSPSNNPDYYLLFPKNLSLTLDSEGTNTWDGLYSLYNLDGSDTKEFNLRFYWEKGNGEAREHFDHKCIVTAGKKKVLLLNIEGDVNETKSGNIIFNGLDVPLAEDDNPEDVKHNFNEPSPTE